jgi:hypothetical protein
MTTGGTDIASYIRGRLHLAGITDRTPIGTVVDVLLTIVIDVPRDALEQWRRKLNPVLWKIRPPDRETWGMSPEQQAAMAKLAGTSLAR